MQKSIYAFSVCLLTLTLACKTPPAGLKHQVQETPAPSAPAITEIQSLLDPFAQDYLGHALLQKLLFEYPLYYQPKLAAYINEVGSHVSIASMRKGVAYRFFVLNSMQVFSIGLPSGDILISRGLLAQVQTESELAGICGVEIVNIERQFMLRLLQKDHAELNLVTSLLTQGKKLKAASTFLRHNRFTDEQTNTADRLAMTYAQHFGYHPAEFGQLLQRVYAAQSTQKERETGKYGDSILAHRQSMAQVFVQDLAKHQDQFPRSKDRFARYKKYL